MGRVYDPVMTTGHIHRSCGVFLLILILRPGRVTVASHHYVRLYEQLLYRTQTW